MSTIDSQAIIDQMLRNDGIYVDASGGVDPAPSAIFKYYTTLGRQWTWKIVWHGPPIFQESEWAKTPVLLWSQDGGLTDEGKRQIGIA